MYTRKGTITGYTFPNTLLQSPTGGSQTQRLDRNSVNNYAGGPLVMMSANWWRTERVEHEHGPE